MRAENVQLRAENQHLASQVNNGQFNGAHQQPIQQMQTPPSMTGPYTPDRYGGGPAGQHLPPLRLNGGGASDSMNGIQYHDSARVAPRY